jgi:hypothetical protein
MPAIPHFAFPPLLGGLLIALGATGPLYAGDGGNALRTPLLPKYQQECAACHLAYPPGLLPAASWRRILNDLPHHYGTDASLDAATLKELDAWLAAHAGSDKRVVEPPPEDRITRSAWFVRKHHDVAAATWRLPAVNSAANCTACHLQAQQGDFNEHKVRIPR